jgi:predicted RNA binding protein YcfA (HicA-like mRNA interferase family)
LSALPRISGREAVKAFEKLGYRRDRQHGSHIILRQNSTPFRRLVVPDHDELAKGTLRALVREAGLTVEEFRQLLR